MIRATEAVAAFTDRLRARRLRVVPERHVRPHNLLTLMSDAVRLYWENWLPICGIYLGPALLLSIVNYWIYANAEVASWDVWPFLYLKLTILLLGPLTIATSEASLGSPLHVGRAYRRLWSGRLVTLIGAILIQIALILSGYLIFVLLISGTNWFQTVPDPLQWALALIIAVPPILLFGAWYMFVQPAIILDHCTLVGAFRRSRFLGNGYHIRNLLYFLTISIVLVIAAVMANSVLNRLHAPQTRYPRLTEITEIMISSAPGVILTPVFGIALVLLYYDLRVRKEGFDFEQLQQDLRD